MQERCTCFLHDVLLLFKLPGTEKEQLLPCKHRHTGTDFISQAQLF